MAAVGLKEGLGQIPPVGGIHALGTVDDHQEPPINWMQRPDALVACVAGPQSLRRFGPCSDAQGGRR